MSNIIPKEQQLNKKQSEIINQETPSQFKEQRPGAGGQLWTYVEVGYVIDELNRIFGQMGWSRESELVPELTDENYITVNVRLTVKMIGRDKDGSIITNTVAKTAFGGAERKKLKSGKGYVDIANDAKSAEADGLKKASSHFGIASDVYYSKVFKTRKILEVKENPKCVRCKNQGKKTNIDKNQEQKTKEKYGHALCADCEKVAEEYYKEQESKQEFSTTLQAIQINEDKKQLERLKLDIDKNEKFNKKQKEIIKSQIDERLKVI